jgi:hypothetical protein
MGKHGSGSGRRHIPEPVKVTRRPTRKPPPTVVPPAPPEPPEPAKPAAPPPKAPDALHTAGHRVLTAASQILGHLAHAPECPFGGGGPCTCGYTELVDALGELRAALP